MTWLVILTLASSPSGIEVPPAEQRVLPVQADLSGVAGLGERSAAGFALYVGAAGGPARASGMPFGGIGFEFVHAVGFLPFRTSYGAQFRAGWAWAHDDKRGRELMPDVMVFLRVTPFVGSNVGFGDGGLPPGIQYAKGKDGVLGLRIGVAVTAPWWTSTLLFHRPFAAERGPFGELINVLSSLLLAPFALLNHVELVGELIDVPNASTITLRLGCGF
ncbi:MAG: hypothetical protein JNM17_17875 [Archangium sp.]|nr:hypothetical protein [Archangium sp.]